MTDRTLVIVVTSPTASSVQQLRDMHEKSRAAPIEFVELALAHPDEQIAPKDPQLLRVVYTTRAPFTSLTASLIEAIGQPDGPKERRAKKVVSSWIQRWLQPFAWKADKVLRLMPATKQLNQTVHQLTTLRPRFDRTYVIYTDEWNLPLAIEVVERLGPDGAGSVELLDLVLGSIEFASTFHRES